jgi:hypothetical protein
MCEISLNHKGIFIGQGTKFDYYFLKFVLDFLEL